MRSHPDCVSIPFAGELRKIRIISSNISYGPIPEPDYEVEQRLTITLDGRVWFSAYVFGEKHETKYRKSRSRVFKIEKATANRIMQAFTAYFADEKRFNCWATDIGLWSMELTNTIGEKYKFFGSLCAEHEALGENLSTMIREALDMPDLFVFDAECEE